MRVSWSIVDFTIIYQWAYCNVNYFMDHIVWRLPRQVLPDLWHQQIQYNVRSVWFIKAEHLLIWIKLKMPVYLPANTASSNLNWLGRTRICSINRLELFYVHVHCRSEALYVPVWKVGLLFFECQMWHAYNTTWVLFTHMKQFMP